MGEGLRSGKPPEFRGWSRHKADRCRASWQHQGAAPANLFPQEPGPRKAVCAAWTLPGLAGAHPSTVCTVNCTLKVQAGDLLGRLCARPIVFAWPAVDSALALPALLQLCPFTLFPLTVNRQDYHQFGDLFLWLSLLISETSQR